LSVLALALALGMVPALATPVWAATPTFTGNVTADFAGPGILTIPDPGGVGDVGLPANKPNGTVSGWDMVDLRLTYNAATDTLYVGINTYGIAGDADGNGDPGGTSTWLAANGGTDVANVGGTETIAVFFDLDKNGTFDVIAGVSGSTNITGFTVANFSGSPWYPSGAFGTALPSHTGSYHANPSAAKPDFEFTILNFSTLPGSDASVGGFIVWAFMGSLQDDGIGEDSLQYEQNPHTIATIVSSAATVVSGGSASLNVTETNPAGPYSVSVTSPQVALTKNGSPLATLNKTSIYYASGDTNGNGILNPGETWKWTNIPSGPITGPTTFVARGSGAAPGDFPVNYLTDPLEQVDVTVNTGAPNTITTIAANATTVPINGKVSLNVTEWNNGSDNLTKPRVEVRQNGTLIATLNSTSGNFSGDNGNGILNTGETWKWINILSKAINATTTFEARGFGTDSQGHEVSYATGYLGERAVVIVSTRTVGWETYPVDKVRVLLPWIALLAAIMVGASLLVLRHRRAQN
jgi:hypothetical protein